MGRVIPYLRNRKVVYETVRKILLTVFFVPIIRRNIRSNIYIMVKLRVNLYSVGALIELYGDGFREFQMV